MIVLPQGDAAEARSWGLHPGRVPDPGKPSCSPGEVRGQASPHRTHKRRTEEKEFQARVAVFPTYYAAREENLQPYSPVAY